ncbi:MAG TPA: hypothetical protein VGP45_07940, partial [Marinobacter sp.]|nr:hypothetical protein [Marinobacter sp.]
RVWPEVESGYQQAQILVTENHASGNTAYLWRLQAGEEIIEKLDASILAADWFAAFNFGEYRGKTTLGFNVNQWPNTAGTLSENLWDTHISTLFHEGFHLFGQSGWANANGGRAQEYPVRWEPRYLRAQLLFALQDSLLNGTSLSAAAYWYEQYLQDFTDEADYLNPVDRIEGSTRYADTIMTALAVNGCEATEATLLADIREHLPPIHFWLTGSSEGYVMGLLAGLLLREQDTHLWHQRVENGETMQGVLLDGISPETQATDTALQETIKRQAATENEYLDEQIGNTLDAYNSEDYYRLVYDQINGLGSFTINGRYRLTGQPGLASVTISSSGLLAHGAQIALIDQNVLTLEASPCNNWYALPTAVVLPKTAVTLHTDGSADSNSNGVSFSGLRVEEVEVNGHSWLCPLEGF